jgi:hypothetical protein
MTFGQAIAAVEANVRARYGGNIEALTTLAREIPLDERDENRSLVGAAIERVLRDAHVERVADCGVSFLLDMHESGVNPDTGRYFDRADRASTDAADHVLESRYNSPWQDDRDPVTTYETKHGHSPSDGTPEAWRLHYRAHYSDAEHAVFLAARASQA